MRKLFILKALIADETNVEYYKSVIPFIRQDLSSPSELNS